MVRKFSQRSSLVGPCAKLSVSVGSHEYDTELDGTWDSLDEGREAVCRKAIEDRIEDLSGA